MRNSIWIIFLDPEASTASLNAVPLSLQTLWMLVQDGTALQYKIRIRIFGFA